MMWQWLKCRCAVLLRRESFPKWLDIFELRVRFCCIREQLAAASLLIAGDESRREGTVASVGAAPHMTMPGKDIRAQVFARRHVIEASERALQALERR